MLAMLLGWRIPAGSGIGGLDLMMTVDPTGELQITPAGPVFFANGLTPGQSGHGALGAFEVRNRTGSTLDVRLRALPSSHTVDGSLRVEIRAGTTQVFSGDVGELRTWTGSAIRLASGASEAISIRAWLAPGATRYEGRQDVSLLFLSSAVGG